MAEWDRAFINGLPDAAFALVKPGGTKDEDGKTVPRDLRMLPHHGEDVQTGAEHTTVDLPHLRNALARLSQADLSEDQRSRARAHLQRHAEELLQATDQEIRTGILALRTDAEGDEWPERTWVHVLSTGEIKHERGDRTITASDLAALLRAYEEMAALSGEAWRGLPFDYDHASLGTGGPEQGKAAGWIEGLEIRGQELWARVRWTPAARQALAGEEFGHVSPVLAWGYKYGHTGRQFQIALLGAALTNYPHLKHLQPLEALAACEVWLRYETTTPDQDGQGRKTQTDQEGAMGDEEVRVLRAEHETQIQALRQEVEAATAGRDAAQGELVALRQEHERAKAEVEQTKAKVEELRGAISLRDATAWVDDLCRSGKLFAAQREVAIRLRQADPETAEALWAKAPVVAPVGEIGHGQDVEDDGDVTARAEKRLTDLMGKGLTMAQALDKMDPAMRAVYLDGEV